MACLSDLYIRCGNKLAVDILDLMLKNCIVPKSYEKDDFSLIIYEGVNFFPDYTLIADELMTLLSQCPDNEKNFAFKMLQLRYDNECFEFSNGIGAELFTDLYIEHMVHLPNSEG